MFNFYFLNSAKPARLDGWDDLVDYMTLCHEDYEPGFHLDENDVTLEEIETEDGSVFEVVCVEGRPVGACRVPATGDLLALLEPRRGRRPIVEAPIFDMRPRSAFQTLQNRSVDAYDLRDDEAA